MFGHNNTWWRNFKMWDQMKTPPITNLRIRSWVADYVILLMTLYDISFHWWSCTRNSDQNVIRDLMLWNGLTLAHYVPHLVHPNKWALLDIIPNNTICLWMMITNWATSQKLRGKKKTLNGLDYSKP